MRSLLLLVIGITTCAASPDPQKIMAQYRAAHDSRDLKAMFALIEFSPDTPVEIVDTSRKIAAAEFDCKIINISVTPLEEGDRKTLNELGKHVEPTLEPVAKFVVTWDQVSQPGPGKMTSKTAFLGVKNGEYRFITAKRKLPNQPAPGQRP